MKRFAVTVLICSLLIAVQCHHPSSHIVHNPNGPVYDGLTSVLSEAELHTQMFADDLTHRINETFNALKERVMELKNNTAFTEKLESFQAEGNKCLKEHEVDVAQFMRKLMNTFDSCSQEMKQEVNSMAERMTEALSAIENGPQRIQGISVECLSPGEIDIAVGSLCVVTRIAQVQQEIFEANSSIENFISHGLEELETFAAQKCIGINELSKDFSDLLAKVRSCIEKNKQ